MFMNYDGMVMTQSNWGPGATLKRNHISHQKKKIELNWIGSRVKAGIYFKIPLASVVVKER